MAVRQRCGNCANACHVMSAYMPMSVNNRVLHCGYWCETTIETHSCIKFETHENAKYCYLQDLKTNQINKHPYPLEETQLIEFMTTNQLYLDAKFCKKKKTTKISDKKSQNKKRE